jgi:hypothetical protein
MTKVSFLKKKCCHITNSYMYPAATVCIYSPRTNLTPQIYQTIRQSVLTTQSQNTFHSCHKHSVIFYTQTIHKLHITAVPLTHSIYIHSPITNIQSQQSKPFCFLLTIQSQISASTFSHTLSKLYSQPNQKLIPKLSQAFFLDIFRDGSRTSIRAVPIRQFVFTTKSQTSHYRCPLTPLVCVYNTILNFTALFSHPPYQPIFTKQTQTSSQCCPTHHVSLSSKINLNPTQKFSTQYVSLYSQPNYKTQPTVVHLTPSVCIHD